MQTCLVAVVVLYATAAHAATFVVDRYDDDNGSCTVGDCTLREALLAAEATPEIDTVMLPPGQHTLSIPETTPPSLFGGDLEIVDFDVDVTAPEGATVDAQRTDRVFRFVSSNSRLENLEITGGFTPDDIGGGVYVVSSDVELSNLWIHDNEAGIGGGIAFEIGTVLLSNSAVTDNESLNHAGGIYQFGVTNIAEAHLEVRNTTISGNVARTAGGATAAFGASFLVMEYTTVANNTNRSGDRTMFGFLFNPRVEVLYSIVEGTCIAGIEASCIYLTSTVDDVPVSDLGLEPLALNGGFSPTHRLQASSPALDVVPVGATCPPSDQRGFVRPVDGDGDDVATCDAGAFELLPSETPVAVPALSPHGLVVLIVLFMAAAVRRVSLG
ncbi:MAG: hypothetical protein MPN21_12895 [Thermoanaerobaculia bacterium]|nr:hypothetical protein [Thermoanaerobaculia bacterium]